MKKQIITLGAFIALTFAFIQAADATESLVATGYTAPIEKLIAGERFPVDSNQIRGGHVIVDTDNQIIDLVVNKDNNGCEAQLICPPNLNNQLSLHLPIMKVEQEDCGVVTYTAEQQTSTGRQTIAVRDNSGYNCRNFMMLPKTTVTLVKETRSGRASALFSAGLLQETR